MANKDEIPLPPIGRRFLETAPTGDYDADFATGDCMAEALIRASRRDRNPRIVNGIIRAVAKSGRYTGIEAGFFSRVGAELMTPSI
ncbi:hypothetical protein ACERNI_13450 [Camelimonas sp. ID_303_24]